MVITNNDGSGSAENSSGSGDNRSGGGGGGGVVCPDIINSVSTSDKSNMKDFIKAGVIS